MNIQKINFYTRGISFSSCQATKTQETISAPQVNTQSLINIMQNALEKAEELKSKTQQIQTKANETAEKLKKTQSKAEKIVAKTIETEVFMQFCNDYRIQELISPPYSTILQLEDGKYDVEITPEKIIATKNNGDSQDIYEIDTETRTLLRCAKGKRKRGPNTFIAEEYSIVLDEQQNSTQNKKHLLPKAKAYIYNLAVSKGENSFTKESFEYDQNYLLSRYSTDCASFPNVETKKEIFEFSMSKKTPVPSQEDSVALNKYSKKVKKINSDTTEKEEEFNFNPNGKLGNFRKNIRKTKDSCEEEISAKFIGENKFFITANNSPNVCPEHSLVCYFENNQISEISML